jgi:hypothetical protein
VSLFTPPTAPTRVEPDETGLWWRLLAWSFFLGGLVDVAFGIGILAAQEQLAPVFGITLPQPRVYLDLNGLLLIGLGLIYFLVFANPRRFAPVAVVATLLRFAGMALFTVGLFSGRAEPFFSNIAKTDAAFALVHAFLLHKAAGSLVNALLRPYREG